MLISDSIVPPTCAQDGHHVAQQQRASLFSLPVEIREQIYGHLYGGYTIRHGFHTTSSNRTALIQTCKQLYHESWRHLPLSAHFCFRSTETLLETLTSVDQAVITRIRYITVKAFPFPLYTSGKAEYYSTYHFANALSLFPGLSLAQLTVEDSFHGYGLVDQWRDVVTYFDIEALLKSDAWRELVYITPSTDFLASGYDHRRKRQAQPETWDTMVKERDGEDSGAAVQMYITPVKRTGGFVPTVEEEEESRAAAASVEPRLWSARPGHEIIENWRLATPEQDLKGEVKIVARRGKYVTCVQKGLSQERPWTELKEQKEGFAPEGWTPYYNDMADAVGWIYGGWGRRMQMAHMAMGTV